MSLMRKTINYPLPVWDFAYILQLEEYEVSRYWKQVVSRLFKRNFEKCDTLKYTGRMLLTLAAFFATMVFSVSAGFIVNPIVGTAILLAVPIITPFVLGISSFLIGLPVQVAAQRKRQRAASYFKQKYPNTIVIAITGSFGKTTAKYMLQHVLQYDYRAAIIPDNLNTALGISHYILNNKLPSNLDILIVEMGAYTIGDIAQSARVAPPDYALLTILGDQHMERFGGRSNLIKGKCEIFTTNQKTICYTTTQAVDQISSEGISTKQLVAVNVPTGQKSTEFLVEKIALDLGVSRESTQTSLASFTLPDRRNNIIERQGVTIIDNSYNISPMVAEAMLQEAVVTAKAAGKKLVVMTGGIGEQGKDERAVNQSLAELLNAHTTRIIINPTIYAEHMTEMLTVPYMIVVLRTDVTDNPATYLDGEKEILLWLTGHGDLAYV